MVAEIRGEIVAEFDLYKQAWNKTASMLNVAFSQVRDPKYAGVRILTLQKDIRNGTIGDCVTEMNDVLSDTNTKMAKLVSDIGLTELLPTDWAEKGLNLDDIGSERLLEIGKKVSTAILGAAAGIFTYFCCTGIMTFFTLMAAITGAVASITAIAGGMLLGMVIGVAVFVIVDIIASAITGAIARKELNEAIDSLTKIRDSLKPALDTGIGELNGICRSITDGTYKLDDTHILLRKPGGTYVILDTGTLGRAVRSTSMDTGREIIFLTA